MNEPGIDLLAPPSRSATLCPMLVNMNKPESLDYDDHHTC